MSGGSGLYKLNKQAATLTRNTGFSPPVVAAAATGGVGGAANRADRCAQIDASWATAMAAAGLSSDSDCKHWAEIEDEEKPRTKHNARDLRLRGGVGNGTTFASKQADGGVHSAEEVDFVCISARTYQPVKQRSLGTRLG